MIPIVTPEEMGAIDAAAPEPVDVLIGRAGAATARIALELLGGGYGRRVVVLVGRGNNGNDGRDAARRLERRGVRCLVIEVADAAATLPDSDLVIDAAFGTGFRGDWRAPGVGMAPVLAVDIPSGVDGLTGEVTDGVLYADRTVSFAALKPGLVFEPGSSHVGEIEVVDIGLDVSSARAWFVEPFDVAGWIPDKPVDAHKWQTAVWVVGGSPGLEGAAVLASSAATRAGAGYVRWSSPGSVPSLLKPTEVVGTGLSESGWGDTVLGDAGRFGSIVLGNGLGLAEHHGAEVRRVVSEASSAVVVDADGLTHLVGHLAACGERTILTPHDGEYHRLMGEAPGGDRLAAARALSEASGATVLLKGPATVVAQPDGFAYVSRTGDDRLATLGSGDVLAGIIGALLSQGLEPARAAAGGAVLHGLAGDLGFRHGLVAGDLVDGLPHVLDQLLET